MTPSPIVVEAIVVATLLVVILIAFVELVLRKARQRRRQLAGELGADREVLEDRAFNQLRMASAEAGMLERDGVDTGGPRRLIADGEAALKRADHFQALSSARTAHEALVALRQKQMAGPLPDVGGGRPGAAPADFTLPPGSGTDLGGPDAPQAPPPGPSTPKNQLEARFQITLLEGEVADGEARGDLSPGLSEARSLLSDARTAQASGDHTEALRLALRGRRRIGGRVESLPPTRSPSGSGSMPGGPAPPPSVPSPAAGQTCPGCGRPARASDIFCRACGAALSSPRCPRCNTTLGADDRFCPSCGAPTAA